MFCKKCGKEIGEDAVFCSYCGTLTSSEKDTDYKGNENKEIKSKSSNALGMNIVTTDMLKKIYIVVGLLFIVIGLFTSLVSCNINTERGLHYSKSIKDEMGESCSLISFLMNVENSSEEFKKMIVEEYIIASAIGFLVISITVMALSYLTSIKNIRDIEKFLSNLNYFLCSVIVFSISDFVFVNRLCDVVGVEVFQCGKLVLISGIIAIIMRLVYRPVYSNAYSRENARN